ncbi:MAG: hypothetical protein EOO60_03705 [Hymenobacter sp.]|nr:MAG: hypothetical protein EOO60_03705 [Hymenobacter sp.]
MILTVIPSRSLPFKEVLAMFTQYADSDAYWWMEPRTELRRKALKAEIVIYRQGQELERRTLLLTAYSRLIRRLTEQSEHPFSLSHASDLEYENEAQVASLRKQGIPLRRQLPRLLNKMLRRQYLLEDAGLTTSAAREWCTRSKQLDKAANWEALRDMLHLVGSPRYIFHSSQLAPLVAAAAEAYPQIQALLMGPYPGPGNADKLDGASKGYRRWYGEYVSSSVRVSWDPDNAVPLPDDYREVAEEAETPNHYEEDSAKACALSQDDIREELVEIRHQIDQLLARL